MVESEVSVVGGGPAGLLAARRFLEMGFEATVFEEDEEVGRPERCAGLFSLSGLRVLRIPLSVKYLQNKVTGAVFYSPAGEELTLNVGKPVAIVARREKFDKMLAEKIEEKGGRIIYEKHVKDVEKSGELFRLRIREGWEVESRYVIDAEGRSALLTKKLTGKYTSKRDWIPIIQITVRNHGMDKNMVYLYFKDYLPDFFAYLVPINEEYGKIGVAAKTLLKERMKRFLSENFPEVKIVGYSAHAIYTGMPLNPFTHRNFLTVGDSAGHVKATTGGGVIMGGSIALESAEALARKISGEDYEENLRRIRSLLGELRRIAHIRQLISHIPPKTYDKLFPALRNSGVMEVLVRKGEMDLQATGLLKALSEPRIIPEALKTFLIFVKNLSQ